MTGILLSILFFLLGLLMVVKGAVWFTDGAALLARRFGVSNLVIGLTIVAFGTSAPELVVSVVAGLRGQGAMAIGNVVGSNLFNTLAILGLTAIVFPVACSRSCLHFEVPMCVLVSVCFVALALKGEGLELTDGVVLLGFLIIFYFLSLKRSRRSHPQDIHSPKDKPDVPLLRVIALLVVGLACLILGGEWFVGGATDIAAALGVSESIIALTIVAAGTSLPELATSVAAASKGNTDMALGNILGSNILNITLVLGVASCITPLQRADIEWDDLFAMAGSAVLMWLFCRCFDGARRRINRWEGAILFLLVVAYYTREVLIS